MNPSGQALDRVSLEYLPTRFEEIVRSIESNLKNYDQSVQSPSNSTITTSQASQTSVQGKIAYALNSIESRVIQSSKDCESVSKWLSILQTQQQTFEEIESDDDKSSMGEFILQFKTNAGQLSSLSGDLTSFLRNLVNTKDTPATMRLIELHNQTKAEFDQRKDILLRLSQSLDEVNTKFDASKTENSEIIKEIDESNAQLQSFSTKESFSLVQKAKRMKILEDEWEQRKATLLQQIDESQKDLAMIRDKERSALQMQSLNQQTESTLTRIQARAQDEMRLLREEISTSASNNEATLAQLEKELNLAHNSQANKEKNRAAQELQKMKAGVERTLARQKKLASTASKTLEASMKKANEKAKGQPSLDIALKIIGDNNSKCSESFKVMIEKELKELEEISQNYIECISEDGKARNEALIRRGENEMTVLKMRRARLQGQISERDIEVEAVGANLLSLDGLISDVTEEYERIRGENELQSSILESFSFAEKKDLEFINKAEKILDYLEYVKKVKAKKTEPIPKDGKRRSKSVGKFAYHIEFDESVDEKTVEAIEVKEKDKSISIDLQQNQLQKQNKESTKTIVKTNSLKRRLRK